MMTTMSTRRRPQAVATAQPLEARRLLATIVTATIYNDDNRNGLRDSNESILPPRADVAFYRDTNNDGMRQPDETRFLARGSFSLPAGTYVFRTLLTDWAQSEPASGEGVTLTVSGTGTASLMFGVYALSTRLTGSVYFDQDSSGTFDSAAESPLAGYTVFFDRDGDGVRDSDELQTTSDLAGSFSLTVPTATANTGTLRLIAPFTVGTPASGEYPVSLTPASPATLAGHDFGIVRPTGSFAQLNGTTLTVFGSGADDEAELTRDASTGVVSIRQNDQTLHYPTGAVSNITWLSGGGIDALIDRMSLLRASVADAGPAGSVTFHGTAGGDILNVSPGGWAYNRALGSSLSSEVHWTHAGGALPAFVAHLGDGRDSAVITSRSSGAALTSGFSSVVVNGGADTDALRASFAATTLNGEGGDDRFYVAGEPGAQSVNGGDGIDGVDADTGDLLSDVEQFATARLAGGTFNDDDLDGALPGGGTAGGWAGGCQNTFSIGREDGLAADGGWSIADASPHGGFDLSRLLPGTYLIRSALTGTPAGDHYSTTSTDGSISVALAQGEQYLTANIGWARYAHPLAEVVTDFDADGVHDWQGIPEMRLLTRTVWHDLDDDGVRDADEPFSGPGSNPNVNPFSLKKGANVLRVESPPAGWSSTTPTRLVYNVTMSGQTGTVVFGQRPTVNTGEVSGRVIQAPHARSESPNGIGFGVAGIQVYLSLAPWSGPSPTLLTTTTDAEGFYRFAGVPPVDSISISPINIADAGFGSDASGWAQHVFRTDEFDTGRSLAHHIMLSRDPAMTNILGYVAYHDDRDGIVDPVPAAGSTGQVRAYADYDHDQTWDNFEPIASVAPNGTFELLVRSIGNGNGRNVRILLPGGAVAAGGNLVLMAEFKPYSSVSITLPGRIEPAAAGTIGGSLSLDVNGNNTIDGNEPPMTGVLVWADVNGDSAVTAGEPTAITDANGAYLLVAAPSGSYSIRAQPGQAFNPAAYHVAEYISSNALANADLRVTLNGPGTITGSIDALRGAGATVYLDLDRDAVPDAGEPTAIADAAARYTFTGLTAGNYLVRLASIPAGWTSPGVETALGTSTPSVVVNLPLATASHLLVTAKRLSIDNASAMLSLTFNDDVSRSLSAGAILLDLGGAMGHLPATGVSWDAATLTATWTLPGIPEDKAYLWFKHWQVYGETVGTLQTPMDPIPFFNRPGDVTGDGQVNFDDLLVIAQNYGQSGRTFSQGNLDRDPAGVVGFDDLLILSQRYGISAFSVVPAASTPAPPVTAKGRRAGVASKVL